MGGRLLGGWAGGWLGGCWVGGRVASGWVGGWVGGCWAAGGWWGLWWGVEWALCALRTLWCHHGGAPSLHPASLPCCLDLLLLLLHVLCRASKQYGTGLPPPAANCYLSCAVRAVPALCLLSCAVPAVQGMVTRKDLLGYRLDEAVKRARTGGALLQSQGSATLEDTPRPGGSGAGLGPADATPDRF